MFTHFVYKLSDKGPQFGRTVKQVAIIKFHWNSLNALQYYESDTEIVGRVLSPGEEIGNQLDKLNSYICFYLCATIWKAS